MKGISSEDFVKRIVSIPGVTQVKGNTLLYDDREIYVLQAASGFPSKESLSTAYGCWRNHNGYKLANNVWIKDSNVPITDLGILLNDNDKGVSGNFIENLGAGMDNSHETTSKANYMSWLDLKSGRLFRTTLNNIRGIDRLFAQFDSALKK